MNPVNHHYLMQYCLVTILMTYEFNVSQNQFKHEWMNVFSETSIVSSYSEPGLWYPFVVPVSDRLRSDSFGGKSGKGLVFRLSLLDARLCTEPWRLLQPEHGEKTEEKNNVFLKYIHSLYGKGLNISGGGVSE